MFLKTAEFCSRNGSLWPEVSVVRRASTLLADTEASCMYIRDTKRSMENTGWIRLKSDLTLNKEGTVPRN